MDLSKFDDYESVATHTASIAVSRHGAHLLSWEVDDDERFFVSSATEYGTGAAIRGGIPVCYPWFGRKASPQHGVARINDWDLTVDGHAIVAKREFDLDPVDELPDLMLKSSVRLRYEVFGRDLNVIALITNTSDKPGRFDLALHSYFAVPDVKKVEVRGLGGANYTQYDKPYVQEEKVLVPEPPLDRVYAVSNRVTVDDLTITPIGFNRTVVWNPSPDHNMADLAKGEDKHFICVEAMVDGSDTEPLAPGNTRELTCRFSA